MVNNMRNSKKITSRPLEFLEERCDLRFVYLWLVLYSGLLLSVQGILLGCLICMVRAGVLEVLGVVDVCGYHCLEVLCSILLQYFFCCVRGG